jgi:Concanavalin A-like lectin/glucanases superfamily
MKRWGLVFILISHCMQAQFFAPAYPNAVSKNNLIVNYDFANSTTYSGTGTSVASITGTNLPATLSNSPVFYKDPGYLKFNTANAHYMLMGDFKNYYPPVTSTTRSGVFTVSLWFNPTSNNGVVLSDLGTSAISTNYHTSDIEMVNGYLKFSVWPRIGIITTPTTVSLNTWHHVVLTYTGNKIVAYLDGGLVGSSTYTRDGPAMASLTSSQYFAIAATESTNMGSGAYGSFLLADLKWFSATLSAEEVNQLYRDEAPEYDLVLMFDGGNTNSYARTGTALIDISGAAKTGTHNSGTAVSFNASAQGNMYYNGAGYSNFSFDLNGTNTITVEMWANLVNLNSGMLFGFYTYDVYAYSNTLGFNTSAGDVFGLNTTQTTGFVNNWKHYTFVMNAGSVTTNKIYVNGVQQNLAQQYASPNNTSATFNGGVGRIGSWTINTNYIQSMYVTTFKIYNRELTAAEILLKFNKTKDRHGL